MPDYIVRLVSRVTADSPEASVSTMLSSIMDTGLTNWIYRVDDAEDFSVIGYYDGHGIEVDLDEVYGNEPEPDAPTEPAETPAEVAPAEVQTPVQTETDEQLVSLAESLNDSDAQQAEEQATEEVPSPQPPTS